LYFNYISFVSMVLKYLNLSCCVKSYKLYFRTSYSDGACIPKDKDFLSRLVETGATESSGCHLENHAHSSAADVLQNVLFSLNDSWHANKNCPLDLFAALPENGLFRVHISLVIVCYYL